MTNLLPAMFRALGALSDGIQTGSVYGFSSGEMLDYVYENRARGRGPLGRWIDRTYLNSVGWRGIRERRANLIRTLSAIVVTRRSHGLPTRIVDIAAGPGRYLIDLAESLGGNDVHIECRDLDADAVTLGRTLAEARGMHNVTFVQHDAISGRAPSADVVVVSGLYEILTDEAAIRTSLRGIGEALLPGGLLVLTGQPWHPQLKTIAMLLTHRDGSPWRMTLRSTATLERWCREAGFTDIQTQGDTLGIFTVSIARRAPNVEAAQVFERLVPVDLHVAHPRSRWAALTPAQHVLDH
jgi:SAM-dependent methyltransferase